MAAGIASRRDGASLPRGLPLPAPAQLLAWNADPIALLRACQRRYGDVFTVRFPPPIGAIVFLLDPADIRPILADEPPPLSAGEANATLRPVIGAALPTLDGGEHRRTKPLVLPALGRERVAALSASIAALAEAEVAGWPAGAAIRAHPRLVAHALDVLIAAVMGVRDGARHRRLHSLFAALLASLELPTILLPALQRDIGPLRRWSRFRALMDAIDAEVGTEIAERRRAGDVGERDDVLSHLIGARAADGEALDDRALRDEVLAYVLAHDMIAAGAAWACERLARHPGVLERLAEDGDGAYAAAVVAEALRVRTPLATTVRRLRGEFVVRGRPLPAGASIGAAISLVHRRPDAYPDPDAFDPERFVGREPPTWTWLVFGRGTRGCPGEHLALLEIEAVVTALARRARMAAARRGDERARPRALMTLAPARGALVTLDAR